MSKTDIHSPAIPAFTDSAHSYWHDLWSEVVRKVDGVCSVSNTLKPLKCWSVAKFNSFFLVSFLPSFLSLYIDIFLFSFFFVSNGDGLQPKSVGLQPNGKLTPSVACLASSDSPYKASFILLHFARRFLSSPSPFPQGVNLMPPASAGTNGHVMAVYTCGVWEVKTSGMLTLPLFIFFFWDCRSASNPAVEHLKTLLPSSGACFSSPSPWLPYGTTAEGLIGQIEGLIRRMEDPHERSLSALSWKYMFAFGTWIKGTRRTFQIVDIHCISFLFHWRTATLKSLKSP